MPGSIDTTSQDYQDADGESEGKGLRGMLDSVKSLVEFFYIMGAMYGDLRNTANKRIIIRT